MRWLDSICDSMDMNLSKLWEVVKDGGAWHVAIHWVTESQTQLSDYTKTTNENEEIESDGAKMGERAQTKLHFLTCLNKYF